MRRIVLLDEPVDVRPPDRVIYSTRPKLPTAEDRQAYFLQGPDQGVIAAEALAYELALIVELPVPDHALCDVPGVGLCFASRALRSRSALETILTGGLASNPDFLPQGPPHEEGGFPIGRL